MTKTLPMFTAGEDLPLFTGQPVTCQPATFTPKPYYRQLRLEQDTITMTKEPTAQKYLKRPEITRITYHSRTDNQNRCSFSLYWMADYHPGHPLGEYRTAERGQVFFADPHDHGFLRPEEKPEQTDRKLDQP